MGPRLSTLTTLSRNWWRWCSCGVVVRWKGLPRRWTRPLQLKEKEIVLLEEYAKKTPVKDGTIINLDSIGTTALTSLAHIDTDGKGVLASHCFENIQKSVQSASQKISSCSTVMNFVRSGFIHGEVVITFDNYDEQNWYIKMSNVTSKNSTERLFYLLCWPLASNAFQLDLCVKVKNAVLVRPRATIISYQHSDKW